VSKKIIIKTPEQIEGIKASSILAAKTLEIVAPFVKQGNYQIPKRYLQPIYA